MGPRPLWPLPAFAAGGDQSETSRCGGLRIDELASAASASPAPARPVCRSCCSSAPFAGPSVRPSAPLVDPLLRWRTPVALSGSGNGLPTEAPHGRRFGLLRHTCGSCRRSTVHSLQEESAAPSRMRASSALSVFASNRPSAFACAAPTKEPTCSANTSSCCSTESPAVAAARVLRVVTGACPFPCSLPGLSGLPRALAL